MRGYNIWFLQLNFPLHLSIWKGFSLPRLLQSQEYDGCWGQTTKEKKYNWSSSLGKIAIHGIDWPYPKEISNYMDYLQRCMPARRSTHQHEITIIHKDSIKELAAYWIDGAVQNCFANSLYTNVCQKLIVLNTGKGKQVLNDFPH